MGGEKGADNIVYSEKGDRAQGSRAALSDLCESGKVGGRATSMVQNPPPQSKNLARQEEKEGILEKSGPECASERTQRTHPTNTPDESVLGQRGPSVTDGELNTRLLAGGESAPDGERETRKLSL